VGVAELDRSRAEPTGAWSTLDPRKSGPAVVSCSWAFSDVVDDHQNFPVGNVGVRRGTIA